MSDLEALVGHLFIVDGRAISSASPGAVASPAPRRAARGREHDTLFALITLGERQRAAATFYEKLAKLLIDAYFGTSGSVTSALRKAISSVNEALIADRSITPSALEVGLACAVLREQELTLTAIGPARCFLAGRDLLERLPLDEDMDFSPRLGQDVQLSLRFYRHELKIGDFLLLSDLALDRLQDSVIHQAVQSSDLSDTLVGLRSAVGDFAIAQVIKFVEPLLAEAKASEAPAQAPGSPSTAKAERAPSVAPTVSAATPSQAGQSAAGVVTSDQVSGLRRIGRDVVLSLAGVIVGLRTLVERMSPASQEVDNPLEEQLQLSTTLQAGIAVSVAIVVALVTTAVYQFRGQTSQYAQLVREAQKEIELARAGGNDQAVARPHWETAVFLLSRAFEIRSPSPEVLALHNEALDALDTYDHVTRVRPVLLREYPAGTVLRGPVVQGTNIYVIDETGDILYREDLDQSGTTLTNREPQIITRQGNLASNTPVGGLIDLAWMESGGAPQSNVLAVIDRNGLLITYSPSWGLNAYRLLGAEAWQEPRAIAFYERDLFVLDAGANEIWHYVAGTDSYPTPPQRTFTDMVPGLADAIDMAIDANGNIYVLHASGQIGKYFQGRQQPFEFGGLPQPIVRPTALFLSISLFDRAFFIADPGGGHLYTTSVTGTFLQNYRDAEDVVFDTLTGVYSVDRPPYVYVTAGNRLFYFSRQ